MPVILLALAKVTTLSGSLVPMTLFFSSSDLLYIDSGELVLTPLELIDRIAQRMPPPRTHRHRYYGVLAPNSPLRATR